MSSTIVRTAEALGIGQAPMSEAKPPHVSPTPTVVQEVERHPDGTFTIAFERIPYDGKRVAYHCSREDALSLADKITTLARTA